MDPTAKTPVMVLQELTLKKGLPCPEYSIIHARQGTHINEFHYQVITAKVSAVGYGRSKQIAKHDAATKALELLADQGLYTPGRTRIHAPRSEPGDNSPIKQLLTVNSIGNLNEICMENKLPFPVFRQISDVGPAHCKEFTYECQIAAIVTRATAGTKKHAKQLAAKDMLERTMQVLPELVAECGDDPVNLAAITDQDMSAMENYIQLKEFKRPKPNLAVKIRDYFKNIHNVMEENFVEIEELLPSFDGERSEQNLEELLNKLQLNYLFESFSDTSDNEVAVALSLNTDVPFTVIGRAKTIDLAKQEAVTNAFEYLEMLVN